MSAIRLAAVLAAIALAAPASAGVRLQLENAQLSGRGREVVRSELLLGERRLKMTREGGRSGMGDAALFDAEQDKLWVLDRSRRSYLEMDREQARATGSQVSSAMDRARQQMEAQLRSLPPEQRAMVERAMKGRLPAAAEAAPAPSEEYRRTGERAEKEGHPCRLVEVWAGGHKVREHWVTDWSELKLKREDVAVLGELSEFLTELTASLGASKGMPDMMRVTDEMGGLPVVTVDYDDGRPSSETRLLGVERVDVPASELQLPEGYTRQAMPGFGTR